ncbi:MAG: hypothetical protein J6Q94_08835 [Clostridia bacterium]|nr:hypothetical protein [Clostridia bacterium]
MKTKSDVGAKFISVILGAIIGGFMWRCRGDGGFGSSWGLYSVGLVFMLLIYHFYGNRKGMKYEMIPLGALMLGLSVTGYATVITQLAGVVWSDLPYSGEMLNGLDPVLIGQNGDVYAPIDHVSGAVIIFLMAFTLIPLFSFFVTSLFSGKEYKIRHYITAIAVFMVSSLIFKASVSHFILQLINPDQVEYAALGLKSCGYDYASPMAAYMSHFLDRGWTQDIAFFENYYMSIEHVSDALAVVVLSLYALIFRKDKYTCFGSLVLNVLSAVTTTVSTVLVSCSFDSGFFKGVEFSETFRRFATWGTWEFVVGFFIGLFLMAFLALTVRNNENAAADIAPVFENRKLTFAFNFLLTVFILGVTPARVIGIRFARLLENTNVLGDDEPLGTILTVVLSVIFGVFMIRLMRRNILEKNSDAFDMSPVKFAEIALPSYLGMCFAVYFFLDNIGIRFIKTDITVPIMLTASALIAAIYVPFRIKRARKNSPGN